MSLPAPIEGRCNARTRDTREDTKQRGYCSSYPRTGAKRCKMHGSGTAARPGGGPIKHGLYSQAFKRLGTEGQERLAELMDDAKLLDARRPVALSQLGLEAIPLEPDERAVLALARARFRKRGETEGEPDEEALLSARESLRLSVALKLVDAAGKHVRSQAIAHRTEKVTSIILDGALPIMERFAERIAGLVERHLPPSGQAKFLEEMRQLMAAMVAEINTLGNDVEIDRG